MNNIELTTIAPFFPENYKNEFPLITKKRFLTLVSLFILWQFILSVVPSLISFPVKLNTLRKSIKTELVKVVEPQQFTYIGIKDAKLVTDLPKQPATIELGNSSTAHIILLVDSTGKTTPETIFKKTQDGKQTTGIALLSDRLINQPINQASRTYLYSDYLKDISFTWSKQDILNFLRTNKDLELAQQYLITPKMVGILILIGLVLALLYYIAAFLGVIVWAGLFTIVVFSLMKPTADRKPQSIFKLAIFAYFGYWFSTQLFSALMALLPFLRAVYPFAAALVLPAIFLWMMYKAKNPTQPKTEKKQDLPSNQTQVTSVKPAKTKVTKKKSVK